MQAIVTGATRGIGKAIALRFARDGMDLCLMGRDSEKLSALQKQIENLGRQCRSVQADLSKPDETQKAIKEILSISNQWDVLVNNAGLARKIPLLELDMDTLDHILSVNLKSALMLAKAVAPGMIKKRKGKIINISSLGAFFGTEGMGAYAVSKAGLNQLTRTMSVEWGKYNIQVNAICPTIIMTDMGKAIWDQPGQEKQKQKIIAGIPAGRFGKPEDVAGLASFLASPDSDYINGVCIPLEGGKLNKP